MVGCIYFIFEKHVFVVHPIVHTLMYKNCFKSKFALCNVFFSVFVYVFLQCRLLRHLWQVWGVAYEISDEDWEGGVREQLDHREKGGYSQHKARY